MPPSQKLTFNKREHHWWEDRLREGGWLGMELERWELALRTAVRIEERHPGGLRGFLAEHHA